MRTRMLQDYSKLYSSTLCLEELSAQACCEQLWKVVGGTAAQIDDKR